MINLTYRDVKELFMKLEELTNRPIVDAWKENDYMIIALEPLSVVDKNNKYRSVLGAAMKIRVKFPI